MITEFTNKMIVDFINQHAALTPNKLINLGCSEKWLTARMLQEFLHVNKLKGKINSSWAVANCWELNLHIKLPSQYEEQARKALRIINKNILTVNHSATFAELQTHLIPLLTDEPSNTKA